MELSDGNSLYQGSISETIEDEVVNVGPGRYRVVSAVWDNKASDYKLIYSNQFEIK